jgi:hypothetical protein
MSATAESSRNIQMHVSEGFCREINKLDAPHLTDLRGIGSGTWGSKEQIDKFIRTERDRGNFRLPKK